MMDTEQRVQALEQEISILKTEIQGILLDIHEQVLSNTYLDLRSNESRAPESTPRLQPQQKAEEPSQPSSFRKVSFNDDAPPDDDDSDQYTPPPIPVVKAKSARQAPASPITPEMRDWVSEKVMTLGADETSELIHMYAHQGRFSQEVRDGLLELVEAERYQQQEAPTQPSRPAGFAAQLPQNRQPVAANIKSVQASIPGAISIPASASAPKPANGNGNGNSKAAAPAPKARAKTPRPQPATPPKAAEPTGDASQNIVLRLIAGVQNAGAGVRWGKKE